MHFISNLVNSLRSLNNLDFNFQTPNPWRHINKKECLQTITNDLTEFTAKTKLNKSSCIFSNDIDSMSASSMFAETPIRA